MHTLAAPEKDWRFAAHWSITIKRIFLAKDCCGSDMEILAFMRTATNIMARVLIWLATLATSAQGLQAATCGCGGGESTCQTTASASAGCCQAETPVEPACCCAAEQAAARSTGDRPSCFGHGDSASSPCQCGLECRCKQVRAPAPATPPNENRTAEKVGVDAASAFSTITIWLPPAIFQQHTHATTVTCGVAALDRCISLCRFTL